MKKRKLTDLILAYTLESPERDENGRPRDVEPARYLVIPLSERPPTVVQFKES